MYVAVDAANIRSHSPKPTVWRNLKWLVRQLHKAVELEFDHTANLSLADEYSTCCAKWNTKSDITHNLSLRKKTLLSRRI